MMSATYMKRVRRRGRRRKRQGNKKDEEIVIFRRMGRKLQRTEGNEDRIKKLACGGRCRQKGNETGMRIYEGEEMRYEYECKRRGTYREELQEGKQGEKNGMRKTKDHWVEKKGHW